MNFHQQVKQNFETIGQHETLVKIYSHFDELLRNGKFEEANQCLIDYIAGGPIDPCIDLMLLTATLPAKSKLKDRPGFYAWSYTNAIEMVQAEFAGLK